MRIIGVLLNVVILVAVIIFAFSFSALNSQNVAINYYFGAGDIPLPVVILIAVVFGALLGIAASLGLVLKFAHQSGRLRRTLRRTEQEMVSLRSVKAKDGP